MRRREFLTTAAAAYPMLQLPLPGAPKSDMPEYRVVTKYPHSATPGMPGRYPGQVVRVRADRSIDVTTEKVNVPVVEEMISRGMRELTGTKDARDAWRSFFEPADVVGIKVNCSGAPQVMSSPEVVADIVKNLMAVGVPAKNIWIYERFPDQMATVGYEKYVPPGVHVDGIEKTRQSILGYVARTEANLSSAGAGWLTHRPNRRCVGRSTY